MTTPMLLQELPAFASELRQALWDQGLPELATQLESLHLLERCRCDDRSCATFYTAMRPEGAWGPGHENLVLDALDGLVVLDLVHDKICCVEVLNRSDVREALLKVIP